jgi:hypothetical protein
MLHTTMCLVCLVLRAAATNAKMAARHDRGEFSRLWREATSALSAGPSASAAAVELLSAAILIDDSFVPAHHNLAWRFIGRAI